MLFIFQGGTAHYFFAVSKKIYGYQDIEPTWCRGKNTPCSYAALSSSISLFCCSEESTSVLVASDSLRVEFFLRYEVIYPAIVFRSTLDLTVASSFINFLFCSKSGANLSGYLVRSSVDILRTRSILSALQQGYFIFCHNL